MNKKFIFMLFAGTIMFNAKAQIVDTTRGVTRTDSSDYQFENKWKRLYQNVDVTKVTTGMFMNRALNFVNPEKHVGTHTSDDECGFETLRSLHTALRMADTKNNGVLKDSTEALETIAKSYGAQTIPFGVFRVNYNCFRSDAFTMNRLVFQSSDTTVRMGSDTSISPFMQKELFCAAPYWSQLEQGVYNLLFPSSLVINNTGTLVDSIVVTFGESTRFRLLLNTPVNADLSHLSGETYMVVKTYFNDGRLFTAKATVEFLAKASLTVYGSNPINVIFPGTASHSGGKATIVLACGKKELTKPLIIAEPFDPYNTLNYSQLMKELISGSSNSIEKILRDMETQGYDLVYIDYNNGADNIQRNTSLFKEVLNHINGLKHNSGSTMSNAVLGISMGAVIARLGLRQMEISLQNHETDLYMSMDGPHQGAYMPASLMTMIAHFENLKQKKIPLTNTKTIPVPEEAMKMANMLRTPAARELLVFNIFDDAVIDFRNNSQGVLTGKSNRDFYSMYNAIGNLNCREIAITNGHTSQKGQQDKYNVLFGDNSEMASITDSKNILLFTDISANFLLKGLPDKTSGTQYYKARIDATLNFGWFTIDFNITNWDYKTSAANTLAYDNSPGGYVGISKYVRLDKVQKSIGSAIKLTTPNFCFVPTTSSLGFSTNNLRYNLNANSTPKFIPFDSSNYIYYTPNYASSFKKYSAPSVPAPSGDFWNEPHGRPSTQSGFALGYELLAPSIAHDKLIDTVIYLAGTLSGYPLDMYLNQLPFLALNYGAKKNGNKNDVTYTSGNNIHRNLTFPSYVKLHVNTDYMIFSPTQDSAPDIVSLFPLVFKPGRYFYTDSNSVFWLSTGGEGCGTSPILITMEDSSEMVLGSLATNKSGVLNINNNATVKFKSGSKLKLYNQSKVIVRKGSTLEIDNNVQIELNGHNCVIEFEPGSNLRTLGTSSFSFTGNGFIRIIGGSGIGTFSNVNIDGKIALKGSGKTDTVLVFKSASPSENVVTIPVAADEFKVAFGKVVTDCELNFDGPAIFDTCDVTVGDANFNGALKSTGTDWVGYIFCFDETKISGCNINGEVKATNINAGTKKLEIVGTMFNGVESKGLQVYNCRTDISQSSFLSNDYGVQFDAMSIPAYIRNITINNSIVLGLPSSGGKGMWFSGTSFATLHLERCNIINQRSHALMVEKARVSMECTNIKTGTYDNIINPASVELGVNSSLILDPSISSPYNAGKVDLSGYPYTIYANTAKDIALNNAKANLAAVGAPGDALYGRLTTNYSIGVKTFLANQNYWKWGGAPSKLNHYYNFAYQLPSGLFTQFQPGSGNVNSTSHLTSPPNLASLCAAIGGPGGGSKRSTYVMDHPVILSAEHIPFNQKLSLKDAATSVFAPEFQNENLNTKLQMCMDIITKNYITDGEDPAPIIDMVYRKLQETIGHEVDKGTIPFNSGSNAALLLLTAQEHLLSQPNISDEQIFDLMTDQVFTYRLQGDYLTAISILGDIGSRFPEMHQEFITKWMCHLTNEKLLADRTISNKQFVHLIKECKSPNKRETNANPFESRKTAIKDLLPSSLDGIFIYPNPATSSLNIASESEFEVKTITITTLDGKEVLCKSINLITGNSTHIAIDMLSPGVYIVHFDAKRHLEPQKLIIVK